MDEDNNYPKLDWDEYKLRIAQAEAHLKEYGKVLFLSAVGFFIPGLVALFLGFTVLAVVLIAGAAIFYQGSSHQRLLIDIMNVNSLEHSAYPDRQHIGVIHFFM